MRDHVHSRGEPYDYLQHRAGRCIGPMEIDVGGCGTGKQPLQSVKYLPRLADRLWLFLANNSRQHPHLNPPPPQSLPSLSSPTQRRDQPFQALKRCRSRFALEGAGFAWRRVGSVCALKALDGAELSLRFSIGASAQQSE